MLPTTRREAIALGVREFNTGRACKHGHLSVRYTTSGICKDCVAMHAKNQREAAKASIAKREAAEAA